MDENRPAESRVNTEKLKKRHIESGLTLCESVLSPRYFKEGFTWQCSNTQRAKFLYRKATCIRLWGTKEQAAVALECLREASELAPGDTAMIKEMINNVEWFTDAQIVVVR
jgi:hypothetical protein